MTAPDWPFVGRVQELDRFRDTVTGGGHRGVVLAGPSGVGKTRLALECVRLAEQLGFATVRAVATRSAAALPLGALAPLLAGSHAAPGGVDDRSDLLRRSAAAVADHAGGRPLLLFVDDAQFLDGASATLVHQLVSAGTAFGLLTVRSGAPAPDPVVGLWKDGLAERIEVRGLPRAAVESLLAGALRGPVDPAAVGELLTRSRDNLLFLRELVIGAVADGALVGRDGRWHLRRPLSPSDRLIELVDARLGRLDPDERALLELVSVAETLGQAELDALSDAAVAEELERRALLASRTDGRRLEIRLAHPLYGDVLRARIPVVRVRLLARSLAEVVEAAGARRSGDALRVASWRLIGGGARPDILLAGANAARWRYDHALAERLARAAVDAGAGFDAALLAARAAGLQGRTAEAERELAALAARASEDAGRGAVALARIDNAVVWSGYDRHRVIDEAERTITDPAWRDQLDAARVSLLAAADGPQAVVEAAAPLLRHAEGGALVWTCVVAGYAQARLGRLADALATAERGHDAHMASAEPLTWYPWWHTVTRCLAHQYAGRFREAEELATEQYRRALADRSLEAQAMFALLAAWAVGERGGVVAAVRHAEEAVALNSRLDRPILAHRAHIFRVLALALAGRAGEAQQALAEYDRLERPPMIYHEVELLQARAWTAAAAGDLPEAHRLLEDAARCGERIGDLVGASTALHGLARLGQARAVRHRLAAVAAPIEGDLAPARVAHTIALATDDAPGLEKASRDFEAMGADLLAAEAAADAAVARRRVGESRAAVAAEHRAGLLVERGERVATPALRGIAVRARLTPAERETALLAAAGRTNRQIADELSLSIRTVENRLQRLYDKLGLSGRVELREALDAPDGAT